MNRIVGRILWASWLPPVALLICALAILYPFCSYYIDPDGTAYLTISQRYAAGDYSTAINGYWSPWSCWLTAGLIKAGVSAVPASWAINSLGAIGVLCSTLLLLKQYGIDSFTQKIMQLGLVCFLSNAVYVQSFDDLWETFFIVCMLIVAHQISQQHKAIYWVALGALGAMAYFAKAYALPYFVLLSIFIAITLYKNRWPLAIKMLLLAWGICAVIATPWWWLLYQKYGFFTTSTAGSLNLSWYLVGHPIFKDHIQLFIPPAYRGSPYYWEDPWLANGALARFWDNSQLLLRQLLKLGYNGLLFLLSMAQLSLLTLWLLYKITLLALRRQKWRSLPRAQQLLVGAILLFPSGYWLINFEARYLWPIMPFCLVMILKWLHRDLLPRLGAQYVLGVLLLISTSFTLFPLYQIHTLWKVGEQEARIAEHLQSLPSGGFTGNAHPQAMARIAYWWGHPYYYMATNEVSPQQVFTDVKRWPIKYYLYFNHPPVKRLATAECLRHEATLIHSYCYAPQDTLYIYQLNGTFKE